MSLLEFPWQQRRAALLVAHPGHELRLFHWLEIARPLVFVLSDGSGRTAHSRLSSTTQVLQAAGAQPGAVYGRFPDAEIYAALLRGEHGAMVQTLRDLARSFAEEQIEYVAHDALEGYNPSHDLCWHLAGAAALLAGKMSGRTIPMFDFLLVGRPDECPADLQDRAIRVALDDDALPRKVRAAEAYPEIKSEVDAALAKFGKAPFAVEWLRPAAAAGPHLVEEGALPFYETYAESRQADGHYPGVIRRREHLLPLARKLWQVADEA